MKVAATLLTFAVGILGVAAHAGHGHDDALTLTGNVPDCAVKCLNDAFTKSTDCKSEDAACMCKPANYDSGYALAVKCVLEGCGAEAALNEVLPAVTALCAKVIPDEAHDALESVIASEIGLPAVPTTSNSVLVLAPSTAAATLSTTATGTTVVATASASGSEDSATASATAASTTAANSGAGRVSGSLLGVVGVAGMALAFL